MLTRRKPMSRGKLPERQAKPDRSAEFENWTPKARPVAPAVMANDLAARAPATAQKEVRHESEAWRRAVASLPCVLCKREGLTQAAHRNEGKGMGLKTDDALTAALCAPCHSEIDQGPGLSRDDRRHRMDMAILMTVRALARGGWLKIKAESK